MNFLNKVLTGIAGFCFLLGLTVEEITTTWYIPMMILSGLWLWYQIKKGRFYDSV